MKKLILSLFLFSVLSSCSKTVVSTDISMRLDGISLCTGELNEITTTADEWYIYVIDYLESIPIELESHELLHEVIIYNEPHCGNCNYYGDYIVVITDEANKDQLLSLNFKEI